MVRSWTIEQSFAAQAVACHRLGSDLYGRLLDAAHADLVAGGVVADLVEGWHEGDPFKLALPLRLMGTVHRLVLAGLAPALAGHFPSTGGEPRFPECGDAFFAVLEAHREVIGAGLGEPVQTNEVGRAAVLLGGLSEIQRRTGAPLALREVGTAGGLNLVADRFGYVLGSARWGPATAAVVVESEWRGRPPMLVEPLVVFDRGGCDPALLDLTRDTDRVRALSYVWPDQVDRLARMRAAISVFVSDPPRIVRRTGADWLEDEPIMLSPGVATVVFHSVVWQYVSHDERARIRRCIESAGSAATTESPFAWLRFEPHDGRFEVRLAMWPDRDDRLLGWAHPHGRWVEWALEA